MPRGSVATGGFGASPASTLRTSSGIFSTLFGVVVLPDGGGGFVHNAAIDVIDAQGRLAGVYDPDAAESAIDEAIK